MAGPTPIGSGLVCPLICAVMASCSGAYWGWAWATVAEEPAQSVPKAPGSTRVTLMPKPEISWARDSVRPSSAHLEAW